jgi:DNA modification methylase
MELIPIDEIHISEERQRRVFNPDSLGKLAESISSKGLFHAPVVQNGTPTLVAGERRLKAIKLMYTMGQTFTYNGSPVPKGSVPIIRLEELSEDDLYEAELEENIRRDNLTPQEEMQAVAKLHHFRKKQNPYHTAQETAAEVYNSDDKVSGKRVVSVRDALLVAEHIDDPAVAKAKTKTEAAKAVHRKLQREHASKLAETFDKNREKEHPHIHVHGDAIETLRKMPSGIVDCFMTDPPYGVGANKFGDMADNTHDYDDSYDSWVTLMEHFAVEAFRTAKRQAHVYAFCDITNWNTFRIIMKRSGWIVWPRPLIWNKQNGMLPKPKHGPRYTYETILFATKGDKEVTGVFPDVLSYKAVKAPRHAAEKPVDVYTDLLMRSVLPGDHICDPFMGSGVIFPAANRLKMRATGIEKDQISYGYAIQRLEDKE